MHVKGFTVTVERKSSKGGRQRVSREEVGILGKGDLASRSGGPVLTGGLMKGTPRRGKRKQFVEETGVRIK